MIRYNSDDDVFEGYSGGAWSRILTPDSSGNFSFGTTSASYLFDVQSSLGNALARFKDSDSVYKGIVINGDSNGGWLGNDNFFVFQLIFHINFLFLYFYS